ncbi:MAG: hypothetical protein WC939_04305 [Acholeplasmataceae bacterium]
MKEYKIERTSGVRKANEILERYTKEGWTLYSVKMPDFGTNIFMVFERNKEEDRFKE